MAKSAMLGVFGGTNRLVSPEPLTPRLYIYIYIYIYSHVQKFETTMKNSEKIHLCLKNAILLNINTTYCSFLGQGGFKLTEKVKIINDICLGFNISCFHPYWL